MPYASLKRPQNAAFFYLKTGVIFWDIELGLRSHNPDNWLLLAG